MYESPYMSGQGRAKLRVRVAERLPDLQALLQVDDADPNDVFVYIPDLLMSHVALVQATKSLEALRYAAKLCIRPAHVWSNGHIRVHFIPFHAARLRPGVRSLREALFPKSAAYHLTFMI